MEKYPKDLPKNRQKRPGKLEANDTTSRLYHAGHFRKRFAAS